MRQVQRASRQYRIIGIFDKLINNDLRPFSDLRRALAVGYSGERDMQTIDPNAVLLAPFKKIFIKKS